MTIERAFFGSMFAAWFVGVGFLCAYEPQNVRLFLLCVKYTFLGLAHTVGVY